MNTLPSMDRHIQQTNDRLLCIKQVCIKSPFSALRGRRLERNLRLLSFPPLLSPLSTLYGHRFFWPLAPVTQIMLHRVIEREGERERRGREGEANLAANTRRDFKGASNITPPPPPLGPVLPYITFLTLDACWPLLWFLLKCFRELPAFRRLLYRRIQIERHSHTDRHNPGLPPLPVINSLQEEVAGWQAVGLFVYACVGVILYISQHPYDTRPYSESVNDRPLSSRL